MAQRSHRPRNTHPAAATLVFLVAVALILGYFIFRSVFAIQSIEVVGNGFCTVKEVIDTSGAKVGDNIFSIRDAQIHDNINAHRYLQLVSVERSYFPARLRLTVEENAPIAKMSKSGMLALVGNDGILLELTPQVDMAIPIPQVVGMAIAQARVGQPIVYSVAGQGEAIMTILYQLQSIDYAHAIKTIDVSLPDSLVLTTEDGLRIMLGNAQKLEEKFWLISQTLPHIDMMGNLTDCVLNVSSGRAADFQFPITATPEPTASPQSTSTAPPEGGDTT